MCSSVFGDETVKKLGRTNYCSFTTVTCSNPNTLDQLSQFCFQYHEVVFTQFSVLYQSDLFKSSLTLGNKFYLYLCQDRL